MKKILLSLVITSISAFLPAQVKNVNLTLNPSYTQQVYFQFGTDKQTPVPVADWDLAFLNGPSPQDFATRINDAADISVYKAASVASDWDNINVGDEGSWTKLYNNEKEWEEGAFDTAGASIFAGWGTYNMATHKIVGSVVFVLKYSDGTYRKFMIEELFYGYTCKFSTWDGHNWSADETFKLPLTQGTGRSFNYYSLTNNKLVESIPVDADWDLLFTQYYSYYKNITMYKVTGALHKSGIKVAKKAKGDTSAVKDPDFSSEINTIGDGWKELSGFSYTIPDNKYYIKQENGTIYKMWFTAFGGTATGNISFSYEDVTNSLGIIELEDKSSFGLYPNPTVNKTTTLVYELNSSSLGNGKVSIFNLTGQKVYEEAITNQSGFYSKELNLYKLNPGIYVLVFQAGAFKETKKLIVR